MSTRTDNFNRGDTTNAIGTPSDGGSAWVQQSGIWGIQTNTGYCSGSTGQASCYLESNASNVDITVTATALVDAGIVARVQDDNNYLLFLFNVTAMQLYTRIAGTFTALTTVNEASVAGDVFRFKLVGSALEGWKNGTLKTSISNATFQSNTKHGLRVNTLLNNFDDFTISDVASVRIGVGT